MKFFTIAYKKITVSILAYLYRQQKTDSKI